VEGDSEEDENNFAPEFTIHDTLFLSEALTFQKDGIKLGAVQGKHDDNVIATSISFQMYMKQKSKNKSGDIKQVLSGIERSYRI